MPSKKRPAKTMPSSEHLSHVKNPPSSEADLLEWLNYLGEIHTSAIDLGLDRITEVAQRGNLTKLKSKVITVAGTNGKGTTCAMIEAILLEAGYQVGVYSSPHLIRYNERVRIQGQNLPDEMHVKAFAAVEQLRGEVSLSFFEMGTLAALWIFQQLQLDIVVLEVGLGGRLDATNIIEHDVSVITSLAIDHVDWLGDDINQIGYEKAGIFRMNKPAVCGEPSPPASVAAYADEIHASLHQLGYQYQYEVQDTTWCWRSGTDILTGLPLPALPVQNAATALMALSLAHLNITDVHIISALKKVQLAGRMEIVSQSPLTLLDVAHNPHSAQYLANQLHRFEQTNNGKIHAVIGMLADKDIVKTIQEMTQIVDHWYPASLDVPRGASWQTLAQSLPHYEKGFTQPILAYEHAKNALNPQTDILVVFGSFHTVGAITEYLSNME